MEFLIKAAQLFLSLSILVLLHEFGHFIPARLFKTRVEKFYLFFNPWFSLFKKKIGDTEWGIGWLPLGGFVKISGMIDESMDKDQMALPPQPWEFRSKPAWQRLIIMLGGVTVNVIAAFVIYGCVVFSYGDDQLHPRDLKSGIAVSPALEKYGMVSGDNILKINDEELKDVSEANVIIMLRNGVKFEILKKDGSKKTIQLPEDIDMELFKNGSFTPFLPRIVGVTVGDVEKGSPAFKAELKKKDEIISINGKDITYYDEFQRKAFISKGKTINFQITREKDTLEKKIFINKTGKFEGKFGFSATPGIMIDEKNYKHINYSFLQSISEGIVKGKNTLSDYIAQFKFVFTKKGAGAVGGFASIGKMFPSVWDWQIFWLNTAFISMALAFMNILPIPALDGGHVVFLLYEIITGKEAPQKVLEYAQYVGFFILIALMLYANGNDLLKALGWF